MPPPLTAPASAGLHQGSNLEHVCDYLLSGVDLAPELTRPLRPLDQPQKSPQPRTRAKTCVVASATGVPFRSFLALNIAVEAARQKMKIVLIDRARKLIQGDFAPQLIGAGDAEYYLGHFGLRLMVPPPNEDLPRHVGDAELFLVHAPASPSEDLVRIAQLGDTLVMPIGPDPRDAAQICAFLNAIGRAGRIPTPYLVVVGAVGVREARDTFCGAARAVRAVSGVRVQSAGFVILDPALRGALASGRPLSVSAPYAASARSMQGVARLVIDDALAVERRSREEWDA
jgi:hypothetical protein